MASSRTGVRAAVRARQHLAVVEGPDAGWIIAVDAEQVVVGRDTGAQLQVVDAHLSRAHLVIRCRRGRIQVQDLGSANGTTWRRARRRWPADPRHRRRTGRIRKRWRTVSLGDRLHAGRSTLEIRPHPALIGARDIRAAASITDGLAARLILPVMMSAGTLPMLLSSGAGRWRVVLAVAIPLLLVTAVAWPVITERIRRARSGPDRGEEEQVQEQPAPPPDPAQAVFIAHHPVREGTRGPWDLGSADLTGPPPRPDGGGRARVRHSREAARWLPQPRLGGGVALVGPPQQVTALARWLVCHVALRHRPHDLQVQTPVSWTWAGTLPHYGGPEATRLRVLDLTGQATCTVFEHDPHAIDLVLARDVPGVPPWCTQIIEVRPDHNRQVSARWAAMIAGALASTGATGAMMGGSVLLTDLVDVAGIGSRWDEAVEGLSAVLGRSEAGDLTLDLLADGPHAVVAGTTGSGKSELLLSWVLSLACTYPPADLAFVLIDYKGGATFGAVADLPHVVGVLTDLDASATSRALASLRAELRRREELLARAGAANLTEHRDQCRPQERLPRLMVIVDEFRVLADEHPDFLTGLVRLAAQGRSLGIHLVLATQRPGGAITADMRANLTVRICLRVLEETDSLDVLGSTAAAHLPAVPGRAILRTEAASTFQAAWCGPPEQVAKLVSRVGGAADALARAQPWRAAPHPPWAPPLTSHLDLADLDAAGEDVGGATTGDVPALTWLRTDIPEQQRLGTAALTHPATVLISGPPRSGRSSAARTLAIQALRCGLGTHLFTQEDELAEGLTSAGALGTVCAPEEVRRAQRLLDLLESDGGRRPAVLIIDGVESWCQALEEATGRGGTEQVGALLRKSRRLGLSVVLTADAPAPRWAAQVTEQLVLAPREPADAVLAGVPRDLAGSGWPPGRGVLLRSGSALLAQVGCPPTAWAGPAPAPTAAPIRLATLPGYVDAAQRPGDTGQVWVGIGGDDARWVGAPLPAGGTWLITGAGGSGRSTALALVAEQLRAQGRTDVLYLDDADRLSATALAEARDRIAEGTWALVGTARPDTLLNTYHDVAARLRDATTMLVLSPMAAHLTGVDVRTQFDVDATPPGRGVLLHGGRVVPVQCADAAAADQPPGAN